MAFEREAADALADLNPYVIIVSVVLAYWLTVGYKWHGSTYKLRHIPTVGHEHPALYYIGAMKYFFDSEMAFKEGTEKARGVGLFKYPTLLKWVVVITDVDLMPEIYRAPPDTLSMFKGLDETIQMRYSIGKNIAQNRYHVQVVRSRMTRNLHAFVPEVHDELVAAFEEHIPATQDWQPVPIHQTILKVIARASNRVFVGLPLCRNPEYVKTNVLFTIEVMKVAHFFSFLPSFLKPIAGLFDNHVQRTIRATVGHLAPEIRARRAFLKNLEDGSTTSETEYNDFLTWLIQDAEGEEQTDWNLTSRILTVNFAAIHTSSGTFTQAMYYLASNPDWIKVVRKEVEEVTTRLGWTKEALDEMHIVDSFVKESQRLKPLGISVSRRLALVDWQLSNGCSIPAGTSICLSLNASTKDPTVYADPDTFDPLRFVKMRADEKTATSRLQMVSTHTNSLVFGHGKTACPGRFFAASEIKLMIAYLAVNYDFKLEGLVGEAGTKGGDPEAVKLPEDSWFGASRGPNTKAKVLFRKRKNE